MSDLVAVRPRRERNGTSAISTERPQQLGYLSRMSPWLSRPGAVAQTVQFFANFRVRHALLPEFDGLHQRQ